MPTLQIEDYVFQIIENQFALAEALEKAAGGNFNYQVDTKAATMTFVVEKSGKELAVCPIRLIGSRSDADQTFLWGWANESQSAEVTKGFDAIREEAKRENLPEFEIAEPFPMTDPYQDRAFAVITSGFLGAFTCYAAGYGGGSAHLAILEFPLPIPPADAARKITVISSTISAVTIPNPRAALIAYLGEPIEENGNGSIFRIDDTPIRFTFDNLNRISNIETVLHPKDSANKAPGSRGFLGKLFGKRN